MSHKVRAATQVHNINELESNMVASKAWQLNYGQMENRMGCLLMLEIVFAVKK